MKARRAVQCESAVAAVASLATGEEPSNRRQAQHVSECLRCQAAVARDRRLRRSLRQLRGAMIRPNPELLSELLLAISEAAADEASRSRSRTKRLVYMAAAGTAAGGAAAGGIAVAIAMHRHRSTFTAAAG
ncbi:MAG: hypothetical protein GY708_06500 [Actinomycetia bacterium]|nr:hypothetical protein [Actinomycetes bacterium]MCP4961955.1 hypothetical protein [Actinomycetes bacterium]